MPKDRDPSFAHIEVKALEHLFTVKKILLVPIELVLEARKCTRRRFVTVFFQCDDLLCQKNTFWVRFCRNLIKSRSREAFTRIQYIYETNI